mmetsp:Transcript_77790/g.202683  ORF Transcript_77790/g.202683 Transcript_77790/m.202683 type:complete len:251 (+) Transcript_77790:845-1597(+)
MKASGFTDESLNSFLLSVERVSLSPNCTHAAVTRKAMLEAKNDLAPPSFEPMKGPTVVPTPKNIPAVAAATASFSGVLAKRSAMAAPCGARNPKIMEPEIIRSTNCIGRELGQAATSMWRKALTKGAMVKKGFRPYWSLSLARMGFTNSSIRPAHVLISPIIFAVAAASPFLIARTIGARVGTTMVTAVIMRPAEIASFLADLWRSASSSSCPAGAGGADAPASIGGRLISRGRCRWGWRADARRVEHCA